MKKLSIYIGALCMAMSLFTGCSDEEKLTPSLPPQNPFDIPADATDPELVIRRGFYEKTGIYFLLSEYIGETTDAFGNKRTEYLDLGWNMTGSSPIGSDDEFALIDDDDMDSKKASAEIIEKYIVSHLGGDLRPYSILPAALYQDWRGNNIYVKTSRRCMVINIGEILEAESDAERIEASKEVLKGIVTQLLSDAVREGSNEQLDAFFDFGADYYYNDIVDFVPDWGENQDIEKLYELGMLTYNEDWYGEHEYDYFKSSDDDRNAYVNLIMDYSEEDFYEEYGDYSMVVTKYEYLKNVISSMGYKF